MANFHQQGQRVHGTQVNADFGDLRGAAIGDSPVIGNATDAMNDLRAVVDALRKAVDLGLVDSQASVAVTDELDGAIGALHSGATPAAVGRVERAIRLLQAAAPVAAIAGTLSSTLGALTGGV